MNPRPARTALSLALAASLLALVPGGCASGPRTRRIPSAIFRSARHVGHPMARPAPSGDETSAIVAERIHAAGYRFGTDGTPGALWGYMRTTHELVDPRDARPGDALFFDTRSRGDDQLDCADRVAVVEAVGDGGRITFFEARGGQLYRGYVDPGQPLTRRDDRGEIINSFLRPKRLSDPDGTRYFAGEMLCGVGRMRARVPDR
jgi:hypothetical protein